MRTSASVIVFCRPSIDTAWPSNGSTARICQVCSIASPVGRETTGVSFTTSPENVADKASRASPCMGVLSNTLNTPGVSSRTSR